MNNTATPPKPKGLENVIALESSICDINGNEGTLIYRGYDINDLAENVTFEEVAYLLWNGDLPTQPQLDELNAQLREARPLPEPVVAYIRSQIPAEADPMDALRTAVSMLAFYDEEAHDMSPEANYRKSIRLTAQTPTIIAAFDRARKGQEILAPKQEGSLAYDFLYMLNGEAPGEAAERSLDKALTLHAEHGLNASTFAARVIGATLADIYAAVTGAIGGLKGPLHGGANIGVMKMLLEIDQQGGDAAGFVRHKLANKEKIMGFGHRVYKTVDPRANILRQMLEQVSQEKGETKWLEYDLAIMQTVKEEKGLDPNVDFFSAATYYLLGIGTDLYTPIFAFARMTGWTAHLLEQWVDNRLIRPRAEYTGPRNRKVVPIEERS